VILNLESSLIIKMKSSFVLMALETVVQASQLKMATISDIHLFPRYNPLRASRPDYCWDYSAADLLPQPAYFGQFKCDPPELLVRTMFDKINFDHENLDVILLTGDLVAHAISLELPPA
jgi:3',5'-cyclic AMP phosphodiesterase CpdA